MKKLLTIALMAVLSLTAGAQEGKWSTGMTEMDELKGYAGGPYYRYDVEGVGGFILWDWNDWAFKFFTEEGAFDVWVNERNGNCFIKASVGCYTLDGKLIGKFEDHVEADHISQKSAWINKKWLYSWSQSKGLKKMLRTLKSGNGYMRIVCKRKGAPDFDLKIMPYVEPSED